jgi:hypothetical protein
MRLGSHHTIEVRANLSAGQMGRVVSLEARAKIGAANRGRIMPPEIRAKISAAKMGNTNAFGCHRSEETRAKMSVAKMGNTNGLGHHHVVSAETRAKISKRNWRGGRQVSNRKEKAKRRLLGFSPLNSWFPGSDAHHVNKRDVIHMPKKLHSSIYHDQYTGQGMVAMNMLAGAFLTEDWT